jgi:N-acetylglucosaminyldiphosphoundecaprenol N-acetyl-beta-D-mannosaminyltransferase
MTCPKQEIWIHQNIDRYDNIIFMAIGGVFDWFAGNYKELNPIWWKLRIGWLGRAIQRPSLLRRNIPNYLIYLRDMFLK